MATCPTNWNRLTTVTVRPRDDAHTLTHAGPPTGRLGEPVTFGVPLPRGLLIDPAALALADSTGSRIRLQARALDRWNDGSIRWALLDFRADVPADGPGEYELGVADPDGRNAAPAEVAISEGPEGTTIDAGPVRFEVSRPPRLRIRVVPGTGASDLLPGHASLEIRGASDEPWPLAIEEVSLEEAGPLRSVVLVRGRARSRTRSGELLVFVRVDVFSGLPLARFDVTIRNPARARHAGGIWELGDPGSVHLRDFAFTFHFDRAAPSAKVRCSTEPGLPREDCGGTLELYQDSSGRPNWQSSNHVNRNREVPARFQGFTLRSERVTRDGLCATPSVAVAYGSEAVSMAVPQFWQNCPKAVEASAAALTLRLFPGQYADTHELQGGEQKTHRFWMAFENDPVTALPLDWCRNPLVAAVDPAWYAASDAVPFLTPAADNPHEGYLRLATQAIDGDHSFERKRDAIDEYGWRHFGDAYADHEAVYHEGPQPFISHYNNQYDMIAGLASQFFMTGDPRWWGLLDDLARHVADIDVYHTNRDKPAFNGGQFWHTYHYTDAGRSSHRAYPAAQGIAGGGPSNEHDYSTGLMLHHFLTGDPWSREAAIGLGEWVIAMDDGRRTMFRWLAGDGDTGLASSTASTLYHGPGRGAGNSIATLVNAHRLTGEKRFLTKAEQLIRRCINPNDDIDAHDLLDAERRWSYTAFLQQLGKYLGHKAKMREFDAMYAYARASLLHYARWMTVHEYPYLDKPEILEYPTETWPAQDLRKCEVFQLAALHATGDERERFLERAKFFFDYSVATLSKTETRTFTRPLVLVLSYGFSRAWFDRHPDAALPPPDEHTTDFGSPEVFEPQKVRAMRRARVVGLLALVFLLGAALLSALLH